MPEARSRSDGSEEPFSDHAYRTLRDGLCHLHGLSPGEEPLRWVLFRELFMQEVLHYRDLRACSGPVPSYLREVSLPTAHTTGQAVPDEVWNEHGRESQYNQGAWHPGFCEDRAGTLDL